MHFPAERVGAVPFQKQDSLQIYGSPRRPKGKLGYIVTYQVGGGVGTKTIVSTPALYTVTPNSDKLCKNIQSQPRNNAFPSISSITHQFFLAEPIYRQVLSRAK